MSQKIQYDDRFLSTWINSGEADAYASSIAAAEEQLAQKTGLGNDFLGWLDLPSKTTDAEVKAIADKATELRSKATLLICIGIGGSYLGSRAAIDFLSNAFEDMRMPRVVFAGHNLNSDYLEDLKALFDKNEVAVNVISKSGTTTEPGVVFRIIRGWMEERYGKKEASSRIVATTDPKSGALRKLATEENYATFPIPSNVGGRFSVLTAVGLVPIAFSGIDIQELVAGAREAMSFCSGIKDNLAARYAINRNILFRKGKCIEVLASFQPQLHFVGEWFKQLAGESEGKNQTGIFPASLEYTTDLHSMGQWMQEGIRNVFETFMVIKKTHKTVTVPKFADDGDGLNFLAGKSIEEINTNAYKGTFLAHLDGGVPCATLFLEDRSALTLGQLFYFFEKTIGLGGYLLRVNPFDQPGVEAYKKNMFALFNKPGYEKQAALLADRIKMMS